MLVRLSETASLTATQPNHFCHLTISASFAVQCVLRDVVLVSVFVW